MFVFKRGANIRARGDIHDHVCPHCIGTGFDIGMAYVLHASLVRAFLTIAVLILYSVNSIYAPLFLVRGVYFEGYGLTVNLLHFNRARRG
jgi:hypothetical protein